jgi:hypothetical protein
MPAGRGASGRGGGVRERRHTVCTAVRFCAPKRSPRLVRGGARTMRLNKEPKCWATRSMSGRRSYRTDATVFRRVPFEGDGAFRVGEGAMHALPPLDGWSETGQVPLVLHTSIRPNRPSATVTAGTPVPSRWTRPTWQRPLGVVTATKRDSPLETRKVMRPLAKWPGIVRTRRLDPRKVASARCCALCERDPSEGPSKQAATPRLGTADESSKPGLGLSAGRLGTPQGHGVPRCHLDTLVRPRQPRSAVSATRVVQRPRGVDSEIGRDHDGEGRNKGPPRVRLTIGGQGRDLTFVCPSFDGYTRGGRMVC